MSDLSTTPVETLAEKVWQVLTHGPPYAESDDSEPHAALAELVRRGDEWRKAAYDMDERNRLMIERVQIQNATQHRAEAAEARVAELADALVIAEILEAIGAWMTGEGELPKREWILEKESEILSALASSPAEPEEGTG